MFDKTRLSVRKTTAKLGRVPAIAITLFYMAMGSNLLQAQNAAVMLSPTPGSTLTTSTVTFFWQPNDGTQFHLYVGTTGVGSNELYSTNVGTATHTTVTYLPANSAPLYVRLWSLIAGAWTYRDYTYTQAAPIKATMTSPVPGATLTSNSVTFNWDGGTGIQYHLMVGTTGAGSTNIFGLNVGSLLSQTVNNLPTSGTIYVRLWTLLNGIWFYYDYTYTMSYTGKATMTTPVPGSTLTASTVQFNWTAGSGTQYHIAVGTGGAGSTDLFNLNVGTSLSKTVPNLPASGSIYVRLWTLLSGVWVYNDYVYTMSYGIVNAAMMMPIPGSALADTVVTFNWTAGTGHQYHLYVGTTGVGSYNIYSQNVGTNLNTIVNSLPSGGIPLYVRLWTLQLSGWQYVDYTYTAVQTPTTGSIIATPSSLNEFPGNTAVYQLSITPPSGLTSNLTLSTSGSFPAGVIASFDNAIVSGSGTSTRILTITTSGSSQAGTYNFMVLASAQGVTKAQASLTLILSVTSTISTVIPNNWVSPAETLMFTSNTNTGETPYYFSMVIEAQGTYTNNNNVVAANACYVQYLGPSYGNVLVLYDDAGTGQVNPGGDTPGTVPTNMVANSQCILDIARSYVQVVNGAMTVQLSIRFKPGFAGAKEIFVDTSSATMAHELYWTNRGTWTVPSPLADGSMPVPVTTDHYNVFRTGANVHETKLTPANAGSLTNKAAFKVDNCVWAQPLYVPHVLINGVYTNVLYAATSNASIYAFNADAIFALKQDGTPDFDSPSLQPLWTQPPGTSTTNPGPRSLGAAWVPNNNDIWNCSAGGLAGAPVGIIGTPVIDLSTNTMFVVGSLTVNGNNQHKLFAIDITTGLDKMPPVSVSSSPGVSPVFNPAKQLQRPGLLLADQSLLFGYAAHADTQFPWQGWLFNFNRNSLGLSDNWPYSPNTVDGAGIWMGGGGPAFDGTRVYVATGNNYEGDNIAKPIRYSNSILQVDPKSGSAPGTPGVGLAQINQYLPPHAQQWTPGDVDLSSSRTIVIPGTNKILVGGKSGYVYIVDRTLPLSSASYSDCFSMGSPISPGLAYWNGKVFTWGGFNDNLRSFSPGSAPCSAPRSAASLAAVTPPSELGAAISISSNFDQDGLLWAYYPNSGSHRFDGTGLLLVYDPLVITNIPGPDNGPSYIHAYDLLGDRVIKFSAPMVANGRVFMATQGQPPSTKPRILVYAP